MSAIPTLPAGTSSRLDLDNLFAPDCPHCGASMNEATIKLGDLAGVVGWGGFLNDDTGICNGHLVGAGVVVTCPECGRESAVAMKQENPGSGDWTMRLAAFWSIKDSAYIEACLLKSEHPAYRPAAVVRFEYFNGPEAADA